MVVRKPPIRTPNLQRLVLYLLGILMCSHLAYLNYHKPQPTAFQEAAETYVAILLALMTPLAPRG